MKILEDVLILSLVWGPITLLVAFLAYNKVYESYYINSERGEIAKKKLWVAIPELKYEYIHLSPDLSKNMEILEKIHNAIEWAKTLSKAEGRDFFLAQLKKYKNRFEKNIEYIKHAKIKEEIRNKYMDAFKTPPM